MAPNVVPTAPSTPPAPTGRPTRRTLRASAAAASVAALAGVFLVAPSGAGAATIAVTTTADGGPGSLRAAIAEANASPGADIIHLPAGTYALSIAGADEDANATGDLDIDGDVTIVGAGSAVTRIDAGGIDRVIDVQSGTTTLQSITVSGGDSGPGTTMGGGIRQRGGNLTVLDSVVRANRSWAGGGIASRAGALEVRRSEIVDNVVESQPGNGSIGGGIEKGNAKGSLVVDSSLVASNESVGGSAGGLFTNVPSVVITNSTFTGNSQHAATVAFEQYNAPTGSASLAHVTIAGNASSGPVGGIAANVGEGRTLDLTLRGVLLQDNAAAYGSENCAIQNAGTIASLGSNLSDDDTCTALTEPTDRVADASTSLGSLADNGGPTRTLALAAGSSAVDAAVCDPAVATDQRGAPRPAGAACDIGAFELGAVVPPSTTTTTAAPTTTTTTAPTTTTTTAPTTTTTTAEPTTTTTAAPTTVAPTTTPPTTTAEASPTTTTAPAVTSTTTAAPAAPTTAPVVTSSPAPTVDAPREDARVLGIEITSSEAGTLPVTGAADTLRLVLVAIALVAGGLTVLLGSSRLLGRRLDDAA